MKKIWVLVIGFLMGAVSALISVILILEDKISSTDVKINRPKIKNSVNSDQDFTTQITTMVKNKKKEREAARALRKANRLIKKQTKN